ncbi:hypothetical protein Q3A66_01185 [Hymenobacter sp. BT770]|uniref:hypothetical protein n=1 Tax=Hymenobacter sp. BT770 TaxID=2886942 RepID=UPI001D12484C|nr:hypothetical protein [Hymenobacter sp. BT770]MCC3151714.1 hypothetical protein [Hymenobacter sp. BT770]MDO3413664.1 hypothetical protein [Hymenobacter sp. BT770]
MKTLFCMAPLALLPLLGQAQTKPTGAVALEIPSPAAPTQGHFLTGAYVVGSYTPLSAAVPGFGYAVQPYLRYQLSSAKGRAGAFVQYSFSPYQLQAYGANPLYGPGGEALPPNPSYAPLPLRNGYSNGYYNGYGRSVGALSVGVPVRLGNGSATLHIAGTVLGGLLR